MRRADNFTTFMCRFCWNLGASNFLEAQGLFRDWLPFTLIRKQIINFVPGLNGRRGWCYNLRSKLSWIFRAGNKKWKNIFLPKVLRYSKQHHFCLDIPGYRPHVLSDKVEMGVHQWMVEMALTGDKTRSRRKINHIATTFTKILTCKWLGSNTGRRQREF